MSKTIHEPKEFQIESKDVYVTFKHNMDKFFDEIENSILQQQQSITNLQRSCTTAWKNIIESSISVQREFVNKSGTNVNVPPAVAKVINDASEEMIKAQAVQNKTLMAAIDATQQGINAFNENAKSFTGLLQSAMQQWISACVPKRN